MENKKPSDIIDELNESAELMETSRGFFAAIPVKKFLEAIAFLREYTEREVRSENEPGAADGKDVRNG